MALASERSACGDIAASGGRDFGVIGPGIAVLSVPAFHQRPEPVADIVDHTRGARWT